MNKEETKQEHHQIHVEKPAHPVPRGYFEPIFYLMTRMEASERKHPAPEKKALEDLAVVMGIEGYKDKRWFRDLNEDKACERMDLETAKRATLVILAYVLKVDTTGGDAPKAYFSKVRKKIGADPVAVPAELGEHRELILKYLVG